MNLKKIWKENNIIFILKNVAGAALLFVVLAWITLIIIDVYTHHNESETVPDLKGLYADEAESILKNHSLYPVIIDSVYDRKLKLGAIVEQTPKSNTTVKRNRPVYIIINSKQTRQIPLPDVNDMSYRQADAILRSLGFVVGKIEYKPSEYRDLVMAVKYRGEAVSSGTRLAEGSTVVLVAGSGLREGEASVPDLKGLSPDNARAKAVDYQCVIGAMDYDLPPEGNETEYFVYRQQPQAGNRTAPGARVDIWLTRDRSLLDKTFASPDNNNTEENFF